MLINFDEIICGYALTPANVDEREVLPKMVNSLHGLLIGDKGYNKSPSKIGVITAGN